MNRDWVEKDFYKVLGVEQTASQDEIKRAYRKLAQANHPDANPEDSAAEERFKEVSEAYGTLSDTEQRKQYDEVRQMVAAGGFTGGGYGNTGFPGGGGFSQGQRIRVEDLGDILGGFGGIGDLFGGSRRRTTARRGVDQTTSIQLSFEDSIGGITTTLAVKGEAACSSCHGTGAEPGTSVDVCPSCGGSGTISQNQGFFSFAQPCRQCQGRGRIPASPCDLCAGSGTEFRTRRINVKIPSGVKDGSTIRLKGKGGPGEGGGPAGDLLVKVNVEKHPLFGRRNDDLTARIPVNFTEAALGAEIEVPTLNGPVRLKLPAGTSSGKTFRIRDKGVPKARGKSGDLLVTIEVEVPKKISRAAKKVLQEYRDTYETENPRENLKW